MPLFRVFMPKVRTTEEVDKLRPGNRPFVTRVLLPLDAQYVATTAVPTLIEALGMMGAGGPPCYGFWIPDETAPVYPRILLNLEPELPANLTFSVPYTLTPLGLCTSLGMLLGTAQIQSPRLGVVERELIEMGADIFDGHPYKIPEEFKSMASERGRVQQVQHAALGKALRVT